MPQTLWTPQGEIGIQRDVVTCTDPMERVTFARMTEIAHKYGISLICKRCDKPIMGRNSGHETVPSVACSCREWRFVK